MSVSENYVTLRGSSAGTGHITLAVCRWASESDADRHRAKGTDIRFMINNGKDCYHMWLSSIEAVRLMEGLSRAMIDLMENEGPSK